MKCTEHQMSGQGSPDSDSTRNTTIVIISASKENVDSLMMGRISSQQFQERVRITEY